MKFLCIALVCLIGVAVAALPAKFAKVHAKCQADPATHVPEEVFEKFNKGGKQTGRILGAHNLCMNVNLGIQSEDGEIDDEGLTKYLDFLPSETREDIINDCTEQPAGLVNPLLNANPEQPSATDYANVLSRCIVRNLLEHAHH